MRCYFLVFCLGLLAPGTRAASGGDPQSEVFWHEGICDASAAMALTDRAFVAASDEDSRLRVYLKDSSGVPIWSTDLARFLEVDPKHPETDIEGAARVGDLIFWITSHGRNRQGEWRESRRRFFATRVAGGGVDALVSPVGVPYRRLLEDLAAHPGLADLDLAQASERAPKEEGALNIEGLAAGPEGSVWIGFRNPIPEGRAVLVQLLNPERVMEGERARLGEVVRLRLAGRGIREIIWSGRDYVIVAGSHDGKGKSRIYRWAGPGTEPWRLREVDLEGFNAEAMVFFPGAGGADSHLLSDDGSRMVGGVECKELKDPRQRSFRSVRVSLEAGGVK
jgi:hypothetical protein